MLIEVEGLSHAFGGHTALRDVGFGAEPGERLVLLGCNGSGKSTLLAIMDGLFDADAGSVRYRGERVCGAALRDDGFRMRFRREVGLVFQNAGTMLFHATVADELAFGPRQLGLDDPEARAGAWAERVGITVLMDRPPYRLSEGEQKKVALAAVLSVEPRLVLLDEPTAGLDPRSTGWLVDFLHDLDATVITATHTLSLARELGDRCLVLGEDHTLLHDGDVPGPDRHLDLLRRANLVHSHRHAHDGHEHSHDHVHDWE
jgi:cobalt/nickel transport system ATP-binding protein